MPIVIGQTIGRYRIEEELGAGGMGVVYRAHDEKLDRDLAIKVLAPGTINDDAARKRFRNEAKVLSKLNHPSIQTIHDFDTIDGHDLLISELVQGVSLDARLHGGPLPEKEVVRLGVQLAQGLAAAHEQGVMHRDLKPSNLRVTPDGRLKILDFGLATLVQDEALSISKTTDSLPERPSGVSGTLPYMSPEQLLGDNTDARSDIYSAGVALFEMATGRVPFRETLVPKLTDAIVHEQPPEPRALVPKISEELNRILLKCLEKDSDLRYQSAKELAADLRRMEAMSTRATASRIPIQKRRPQWVYAALVLGVLAGITLVATIASWVRGRNRAGAVSVVRWEQITNFNDSAQVPALSPDGKVLAFIRGPGDIGQSATRGEMWIKMLPDGDPVQVSNDKYRKQTPAFSRDGSRLYFTRIEEKFTWNTYEVGLLGGQQEQPFMKNATGLSWIGNGRLLFSEIQTGVHMGLMSAGASRADERMIYMPKTERGMVHRSALSPDGRWVLLVEMDGAGWLPCRLVPFDGSSEGREVGPPSACTFAQWAPDGKAMYFTAEARGSGFHIWRQPFPDGPVEQLTPSGATEEEGLVVAPDGKSLITAAGTRESSIWFHDAQGERQLTTEGYAYMPSVAPDGTKVYYVRRIPGSRSYVSGELWAVEVATAKNERILPGIVVSHYSIAPNGKRVVFAMAEGEQRSGIWVADLVQTQAPRQLTKGNEFRVFFAGNDYVVYQTDNTKSHLARIRIEDGAIEEVKSSPILHLVSVSPDGNWAAVVFAASAGHGDRGVGVRTQPLQGGEPVPVCDDCMVGFGPSRALAPIVGWSPDGRFQYLSVRYFGLQTPQTLVVPLRAGKPTALNSIDLESDKYFARLPGALMLPHEEVFPGPSPDVYAFTQRGAKTNLFRLYLSP